MTKLISNSINVICAIIINQLLTIISDPNSPLQYRLRYAITENQPLELRIGKIDDDLLQTPEIQTSELYDLLQNPNQVALRYKLREPSTLFQLDEISSILITKKVIDLESLCPRYCKENTFRAQLNMYVNIWENFQIISTVHVEVTIIDVDDNSPRFPDTVQRPYRLQLKEVIYRQGQQVELPKAIDKDVQPSHAELAYRLDSHPDDRVNSLDAFRLHVRNDTRLMLILQRDLDYEQTREYRFYLVAWSPRINERTTQPYANLSLTNMEDKLEIIIEVLNINDIEPVFSQSVYRLKIPENTPINSVIFELKATDKDANSTINYLMENGVEANISKLFQVKSNGHIVLIDKLDYEQRNHYMFSVRASDGEFFAVARIAIKLTNVNDEPPEYVLNPHKLTIKENKPSRTLVGHLLIIDRDGVDLNGRVQCEEPTELAGQQPLLFVHEPNYLTDDSIHLSQNLIAMEQASNPETHVYHKFTLFNRIEFDRESGPTKYESLLVCWDSVLDYTVPSFGETYNSAKKSSLTSTLTITLHVLDENDNVPVFKEQFYKAEIKENCPLGTKVLKVEATDADTGRNGQIQYKLQQNELFASNFEIDTKSGWVVTSSEIDRETQTSFQLTVLAIDGEPNPIEMNSNLNLENSMKYHTATAYIRIQVSDENDNAPEFRGPRQFAVEENQPAHTWIGDLQVLDRDEGSNKLITFQMTQSTNKHSLSRLTQLNSPITNNKYLDRMNGNGRQDYLPFKLMKNGSIFTTTLLDRENKSHYCFEVTAFDNAQNKTHSTTDTICVRVLDMNDNAPVFIDIRGASENFNDSYFESGDKNLDTQNVTNNLQRSVMPDRPTVHVSVNEVPGYCALIVTARDADENRNAQLRYSIFKDKNLEVDSDRFINQEILNAFTMDPPSGRMMLTRNLNFDDIGSYELKLIVEDNGEPVKWTEKIIQLIIDNSQARGNWLFPESAHTQDYTTGISLNLTEAHTILIVIILSGVSAFLAAVLISAILCMIRPCRKARQARGGGRTDKMIPDKEINPIGMKYSEQGGSIDDYHLHLLNNMNNNSNNHLNANIHLMSNGYSANIDPSATLSRTGLILSTSPISDLDHLYLPQEKLIELDTSCKEQNGWQTLDLEHGVLPTLCTEHTSSPMNLTSYTPYTSVWNNNYNQSFNLNVSGRDYQPAMSANYSSNFNTSINRSVPNDPTHQYINDNSNEGDQFSTTLEQHQQKQHTMSNYINTVECVRNNIDLQAQPSSVTTRQMVSANNNELNTIGEEQRSDSGRGASDEEVPNQIPTSLNQANYSANMCKMRSNTLKHYQDSNTSYITSGLIFPSLPRYNPKKNTTDDPILGTFQRKSSLNKPPKIDTNCLNEQSVYQPNPM